MNHSEPQERSEGYSELPNVGTDERPLSRSYSWFEGASSIYFGGGNFQNIENNIAGMSQEDRDYICGWILSYQYDEALTMYLRFLLSFDNFRSLYTLAPL